MLAAEEGGMDLGIGQQEGAPGGLPALLRAALGGQLGQDLAYFGDKQRTASQVAGAITDSNPPRGMSLTDKGIAQDGSGNTYEYDYNKGGWYYNPLLNTDNSDNRTESNRRGGG